MSPPSDPGQRPDHTSRLDLGLAVVIAVGCFAAGAAAQPKIDLRWDLDRPAAASVQSATQLVRAQQQAQDKQDTRKALSARIAAEQVDQDVDRVALDRAEPDQVEKLRKRVAEREALMAVLRGRLDAVVEAQSAADDAVRTADDKAKKSERAAAELLARQRLLRRAGLALSAWLIVIALGLGLQRLVLFWRARLVHGWVVGGGSLAGLVMLLAGASLGWVTAAVLLLMLLAGWVLRPGGRHA